MKRVSGFLLPLLLVLLVIPAVAAIGLEPVNGLYGLDLETKTITEEEVAVEQHGETLAALAVEPKPAGDTLAVITMVAGTAEYGSPTVAGGIPVLPGGIVGAP
ncbi:MAG: hypothetical protein WD492_12715 [Alkalispirochaeta sp.]